nr:hypothetical protein BHI3_08930 [Bacteriovorax sp. HI3]
MQELDNLINRIGILYAEFVKFQKTESCPVSPNDHIIGPIGEWRAIQIIKNDFCLDASRVSISPKDPDDLMLSYNGEIKYISVKTTTEHSKTGLSGIFHTDKGKWDWLIAVRLNEDLTYKEHFWLSKKDCYTLFRTKKGKAKQFKWSTAYNSPSKKFRPDWFQD